MRLNTGEVGVVIEVHAPEPYRPHVRVIFDRAGTKIDLPYEVNLWEVDPAEDLPSSISAPLNPADYDIDPLSQL